MHAYLAQLAMNADEVWPTGVAATGRVPWRSRSDVDFLRGTVEGVDGVVDRAQDTAVAAVTVRRRGAVTGLDQGGSSAEDRAAGQRDGSIARGESAAER